MRRAVWFGSVALVACAIAGRVARGQSESGSSPPVRVDVTVMLDRQPVAGLTAADLTLTDNGVPQTIARVAPAGHVALALVIDTNTRTAETWKAEVQLAQSTLQLLGPSDVSAVVVAGDRLSVVSPLGASSASAARAIGELAPRGLVRPTIWDPAMVAAGLVASDAGRPVVLLISKGLDEGSWTSESDALTRLKASGLALDAISVEGAGVFPELLPWNDIAKLPGSLVVQATDKDAAQRLGSQFTTFRGGYVITFTPAGVKTGDGEHTLKVSLVHAKGDVVARESYISVMH